MRILITGASGYYGTILTKHLLDCGHDCVGIDLLPSKVLPVDSQIECDLSDIGQINKKVNNLQFDILIHLAAQIDFAVKNQRSLYENNVTSTKNVAILAQRLGISKLIFTSSNSVFLGNNSTYISPEDTPIPMDYHLWVPINFEC